MQGTKIDFWPQSVTKTLNSVIQLYGSCTYIVKKHKLLVSDICNCFKFLLFFIWSAHASSYINNSFMKDSPQMTFKCMLLIEVNALFSYYITETWFTSSFTFMETDFQMETLTINNLTEFV